MADRSMTYHQAAQCLYSGISFDQQHNLETNKSLRHGINSAHVTNLAVARLLIAKGLVTEAEYTEAIRVAMIDEVERYEKLLSEHYGTDIILG